MQPLPEQLPDENPPSCKFELMAIANCSLLESKSPFAWQFLIVASKRAPVLPQPAALKVVDATLSVPELVVAVTSKVLIYETVGDVVGLYDTVGLRVGFMVG